MNAFIKWPTADDVRPLREAGMGMIEAKRALDKKAMLEACDRAHNDHQICEIMKAIIARLP